MPTANDFDNELMQRSLFDNNDLLFGVDNKDENIHRINNNSNRKYPSYIYLGYKTKNLTKNFNKDDDYLYWIIYYTNGKIYAVDINSKDVDWEYTTGDSIYSSPSYGDEKIFVGSDDGSIYAINESDGKLDWKVDLNNKVRSSPTIDEYDNNIFIGSDEGNLTCLDIRDGTVKWSHSTSSPVRSTAALKENQVVFGSNDGSAHVLNKYSGIEDFSYNPGCMLFNSPVTSSPAINGNSLFISGNDGYLYSLNIEKNEAPASVFLYYTLAILAILLVVIIVVVRKVRK